MCPGFHVKAAVLPFVRFPGADPVLGPEMRSTGEVMASASDLPTAFAKAERAAGRRLPASGTAFLSVRDEDKDVVVPVAQALAGLGFRLLATAGTARTLASAGLAVEYVRKVTEEGDGPSVVDLVRRGRCDLVVNTPQGSGARTDGYRIREAALVARVPCITTVSGAAAAVEAIAHARDEVALSLQERIQDGGTHGSPVGPLLRDSGEAARTVAPAGQGPAPPATVAPSQKEEPGAARSA